MTSMVLVVCFGILIMCPSHLAFCAKKFLVIFGFSYKFIIFDLIRLLHFLSAALIAPKIFLNTFSPRFWAVFHFVVSWSMFLRFLRLPICLPATPFALLPFKIILSISCSSSLLFVIVNPKYSNSSTFSNLYSLFYVFVALLYRLSFVAHIFLPPLPIF